jgi:hypothetical protein
MDDIAFFETPKGPKDGVVARGTVLICPQAPRFNEVWAYGAYVGLAPAGAKRGDRLWAAVSRSYPGHFAYGDTKQEAVDVFLAIVAMLERRVN